MRLKKVQGAIETLQEDTRYFIKRPTSHKGLWKEVFANENPINIEVGCGKGKFAIEMAKANPLVNFIAIEKYDSVLVRALENALAEELPNLRLMLFDANDLDEVFAKEEVENIYLNFSDPWPKARHSKRRLTSTQFLGLYEEIISTKGCVFQKTDNRVLFEYSLMSFSQNNWYLSNISLDLHKDEIFNITTEFEDKWSDKGPIYRLEARKVKQEEQLKG